MNSLYSIFIFERSRLKPKQRPDVYVTPSAKTYFQLMEMSHCIISSASKHKHIIKAMRRWTLTGIPGPWQRGVSTKVIVQTTRQRLVQVHLTAAIVHLSGIWFIVLKGPQTLSQKSACCSQSQIVEALKLQGTQTHFVDTGSTTGSSRPEDHEDLISGR